MTRILEQMASLVHITMSSVVLTLCIIFVGAAWYTGAIDGWVLGGVSLLLDVLILFILYCYVRVITHRYKNKPADGKIIFVGVVLLIVSLFGILSSFTFMTA